MNCKGFSLIWDPIPLNVCHDTGWPGRESIRHFPNTSEKRYPSTNSFDKFMSDGNFSVLRRDISLPEFFHVSLSVYNAITPFSSSAARRIVLVLLKWLSIQCIKSPTVARNVLKQWSSTCGTRTPRGGGKAKISYGACKSGNTYYFVINTE
jgi:hypothetical protein